MAQSGNKYSFAELFVFVGFICLLFSVSVSMLHGAQEDARLARARADVLELKRMALIASVESNKSIEEITGQSCSVCICTEGSLAECRSRQEESFQKLSDATKGVMKLVPEILTDPWGNPYFIHEVVGEQSGICFSEVFSAGNDRSITKGEDNITVTVEEAC